MQIQGSYQVHGPQALSGPHRPASAQKPQTAQAPTQTDELDISSEADYVSRTKELPDIRTDRVADIRSQIASGAYETDEKLDLALSRLLDELA